MKRGGRLVWTPDSSKVQEGPAVGLLSEGFMQGLSPGGVLMKTPHPMCPMCQRYNDDTIAPSAQGDGQ